jgi:hypothetical protein
VADPASGSLSRIADLEETVARSKRLEQRLVALERLAEQGQAPSASDRQRP